MQMAGLVFSTVVGGLVGIISTGTITACYSTGNANGGDGNFRHCRRARGVE